MRLAKLEDNEAYHQQLQHRAPIGKNQRLLSFYEKDFYDQDRVPIERPHRPFKMIIDRLISSDSEDSDSSEEEKEEQRAKAPSSPSIRSSYSRKNARRS